jgi:methylmalonyl-CoA/ethylmalonyl-CoA epimerase
MLPAGAAFVQLLESSGPGVIEQFLQRRGPGLHHVAFEVTSIEAAVADLRERGVRMVDEVPRPGGMGTTIAFIHPQACAGLLVELVGAASAETAAERRAEE